MKFSQATKTFYEIGQGNYSAKTLALYSDHLRRFEVFIENKNIEDIGVIDDVLNYRRQLERRGLSDSTINLSMTALRQMWKTLCGLERELKITMPFMWYAIPIKKGIVARSHRPIETSEFKDILNEVTDKTDFQVARDNAILYTLFHSGMRVSELTALNVSSLNISDQSILTVTRKRRDGKATRRVYLPKEAMVVLTTYLDIREDKATSESLFVDSIYGKRLTPRTIQRVVKFYSKKAGLDGTLFKPHSFRHGWGKRAAQLQMYPPHIQAQLGHTNLSGSEVYFNITNTALKQEVLQKMDVMKSNMWKKLQNVHLFGIKGAYGKDKKYPA